MKIKIEKTLKKFLKQNKAYKRFRRNIHLYHELSTSKNVLNYYKGRRCKYTSILSSFVINDVSSNQQENDFWWNLNSKWQDFINQHTELEEVINDEPTPYWWKENVVDDPYKEENDARENDW